MTVDPTLAAAIARHDKGRKAPAPPEPLTTERVLRLEARLAAELEGLERLPADSYARAASELEVAARRLTLEVVRELEAEGATAGQKVRTLLALARRAVRP